MFRFSIGIRRWVKYITIKTVQNQIPIEPIKKKTGESFLCSIACVEYIPPHWIYVTIMDISYLNSMINELRIILIICYVTLFEQFLKLFTSNCATISKFEPHFNYYLTKCILMKVYIWVLYLFIKAILLRVFV